jgi:hypothetical protein
LNGNTKNNIPLTSINSSFALSDILKEIKEINDRITKCKAKMNETVRIRTPSSLYIKK